MGSFAKVSFLGLHIELTKSAQFLVIVVIAIGVRSILINLGVLNYTKLEGGFIENWKDSGDNKLDVEDILQRYAWGERCTYCRKRTH